MLSTAYRKAPQAVNALPTRPPVPYDALRDAHDRLASENERLAKNVQCLRVSLAHTMSLRHTNLLEFDDLQARLDHLERR